MSEERLGSTQVMVHYGTDNVCVWLDVRFRLC